MNPEQLKRLDAQVEKELAAPSTSRAAARLAADTQRTAEHAQEARKDVTRRDLSRAGGYVVGHVGTQQGRELELVAVEGHVLARTPGMLTPGVLFAIDAAGAAKLDDLLSVALENANTAPKGTVGMVAAVDRMLRIERTATGVMVRDAAISSHASVLVQMNGHQAESLIRLLKQV